MNPLEELVSVVSLEEQEWRNRAACRDEDPDLFFPERGESIEAAKEICGRCPVRLDCLRYALKVGIHHGVWGGASERARRRMRRHRAEFAAETEETREVPA